LLQVKTNRIVTNKQVVAEQGQESQSEAMSWMRFYKCIDPESYFMTIWTIAFVTLIIYISTVGLMVNTFDLDVETMSSDCKWSAFAWFDLAVDTFFVIDIFGRAFLFGVTVDSGRTWSGELPEAILQPDIVFRRYVKQGMTLDIVTGFPLQWVIMSRFSPCESAGDLSTLRLLRIFRVTRVFKIFQRPIIRKWMRLLRRRVGNNNVLQIWSHLATVVFFTHVWSCLSWMIQALDQDDPNGDGRSGFDEWKDALMIDPPHWFGQYTILFSVTLQVICSQHRNISLCFCMIVRPSSLADMHMHFFMRYRYMIILNFCGLSSESFCNRTLSREHDNRGLVRDSHTLDCCGHQRHHALEDS
jgi:hypothetical protein